MDSDGSNLVDVTQTTTGQALILRVTGDIDLATSGTAHARLQAAVAALPPPWLVVVDLDAVEFFGAAGVRLLRWLVDVCADQGVSVHLIVGPQGIARRVIKITGLDEEVPTSDNLDQALGAE